MPELPEVTVVVEGNLISAGRFGTELSVLHANSASLIFKELVNFESEVDIYA